MTDSDSLDRVTQTENLYCNPSELIIHCNLKNKMNTYTKGPDKSVCNTYIQRYFYYIDTDLPKKWVCNIVELL